MTLLEKAKQITSSKKQNGIDCNQEVIELLIEYALGNVTAKQVGQVLGIKNSVVFSFCGTTILQGIRANKIKISWNKEDSNENRTKKS